MNPKEIGKEIHDRRKAKDLSQDDLAERVGLSQAQIWRIESGQFKKRPSALPEIYAALEMPPDQAEPRVTHSHPPTLTTPVSFNLGERNLPVYALSVAGDGAVVRSTEPVEHVPRPAPLAHVTDGYGLIVPDDTMRPELKLGETALVHPHLPPIRDEASVFYADSGAGGERALIASFVKQTDTHWHVEQWNPPKKISLPKAEWKKAHRVVGKYARR